MKSKRKQPVPRKPDGKSPVEMRKGRLDLLEGMYLRPWEYETKIAKFEIDELRAERPHIFAKDVTGFSAINITGGVRGVANFVRQNYPGLNPSHMDIQDWIRGERLDCLPVPCKDFFPAGEASGSGRFKTVEVRAWVEKYLLPKAGQPGTASPLLDDRRRKEKADADLAEMAAELERKRTSGLYVLTEVAQRTGTAIGIEMRTLTRDMMERHLVKRLSEKLPLDEATALGVSLFEDWQKQAAARMVEIMNGVK
jgi:hypothetical protein